MIESTHANDSVQAELNQIADEWIDNHELPEEVTNSEIVERSQELHDQYEPHIQTYTDETFLSQAEAEIRALRKFIGEDRARLSWEAITLLLSRDETPFKAAAESVDEYTPTSVGEFHAQVESKVEQAKQLVIEESLPGAADRLSSPSVTVLNGETKRRLRSRANSSERTEAAVVNRLVDETATKRSLREFCKRYLDEHGPDNVTQLEVHEESLPRGLLLITAHGNQSESVPEVVAETDIITIAGREYDFEVVEDPWGPTTFNTFTIHDTTDSQPDDVRFDVAIRTIRKEVLELQEQDSQPA